MRKSNQPKLLTHNKENYQEGELYSILHPKRCPYSPSKESDLSLSGEDTSLLFSRRPQKQFASPQNKLDFDLSSIESSPTKHISQNLTNLRTQILNLTKKFSNHQEDVKELTGENAMLRSKIIKLQENLIAVSEMNAENRSKCSCSVF